MRLGKYLNFGGDSEKINTIKLEAGRDVSSVEWQEETKLSFSKPIWSGSYVTPTEINASSMAESWVHYCFHP